MPVRFLLIGADRKLIAQFFLTDPSGYSVRGVLEPLQPYQGFTEVTALQKRLTAKREAYTRNFHP